MEIKFCYVSQDYYSDNPDLVKILDINDSSKYNVRTHLCLNVQYNGNNILIPLRKNLGEAVRPFGRIGFSVPSESKPKAGLDYRYILIINDDRYIRYDVPRISNGQIKTITRMYDIIEKQSIEYINSYIKVAKKNRVDKVARFRESSLINYHKELGIM